MPQLVSDRKSANVDILDTNRKNTGLLVANGHVLGPATQTAKADTATLTAAEILTGVIDGTPVSAATYTLPTAALLVAAIPGVKAGAIFDFIVTNKGADTDAITVAAGSGGTALGTLTIAQNACRLFRLVITAIGTPAYTVYGTV